MHDDSEPDDLAFLEQFPPSRLITCSACDGYGLVTASKRSCGRQKICKRCDALGVINASAGVCEYPAGSPDKVATMAARYRLGLPLWHDDDCKLVLAHKRSERAHHAHD